MMRSIAQIGALWPRCATCGHIAQSHNASGPECCGEYGLGQCPTCKTHDVRVRCQCQKYVGPTWDEFKTQFLTPEEITRYGWGPKNDGLDEYRKVD